MEQGNLGGRRGNFSLKWERVDPARARVSAPHGVGDGASLGGRRHRQPGRACCLRWIRSSRFRSAIHLHGSAPHRESGAVSGARARAARGGAHQGKHDHAPGRPRVAAGARTDGETPVHGIGCRHGLGTVCSALQERPARWPVGCSNQLCEGEPTSATSGGHGQPGSGPGLKGQVTTATPLRSGGAGHEGGPREPVVDARGAGVVNGLGEDARRNRPDSRALAWASDARARRLCLRNAGRARAAPGVDDRVIGLWW
jgi:hypothetical protein